VVQRLSDFRVPVRSVVTFSFERRVRTGPETESDAERVNDPATVAEESSEDPVYFGADLTTTPPARPPLQTRLSITFQESSDAEEEDQQPQPQKEKEKGKREEEDSGTRWEFKTEREEMSRLSADGEPAVAVASPPPLPRAAGLVSVSFPCAAQESEVGSGCSRQEVEKLQREIENLRRDLLAVSAQRDELLDELDDLRMKLEMTSGERNEFLRQVHLFPFVLYLLLCASLLLTLLSPILSPLGSWEMLRWSAKSLREGREMPWLSSSRWPTLSPP
jgi:hypothetical protein